MKPWQRGSITVFIVIVLAVIVPLCGILIDLVRFNEALKLSKSSLKVCTESMLAAYDRQLKEQFSLFAMCPRDKESMEKEIYELLSDNLTPENAEGKVTDLYGFSVNRVEVIPFYNLSEPYVLEQQVTEFMKYRAPVQAVSEFIDKLKAMVGLMKESDMIERNMEVDRKLNAFRGDMMHYTLLMKRKMISINFDGGSQTLKFGIVSSLKKDGSDIENHNNQAKPLVETVNQSLTAYREARQAYDKAQSAYNQAYDYLKSIEKSIADINISIASINKELENPKLTESQKDDKQKAISDLAAKAGVLAQEESSASRDCSEKQQTLSQCSSKLDQAKNTLAIESGKLHDHYAAIQQAASNSIQKLDILIAHLRLHFEYHNKALELARGLLNQFTAIKSETETLKAETEADQTSGVSSKVGADLDKKVQSMDTDLFNTMISQLEKNKAKLEGWLKPAETARLAYQQALDPLVREITSVSKLMNDPGAGDTKLFPITSFDSISTSRQSVESALSDFESLKTMAQKETFTIPDYTPEPKPTEIETKEFTSWYYTTFNGIDPNAQAANAQEQVEDSKLQDTRDRMSGTANSLAGLQTEDVGPPGINLTPEVVKLLTNLPSQLGSKSSEEALDQILDQTIATAQNQLENPLAGEAQGLDTVNENEKNYFNYEIERIKKLLDAVKKFVEYGLESMMKSLYMNEYIVSAFKNATTKDNQLEYDIGWDRPLEDTVFQKGEVEYILFGNAIEEDNIAASQRSVFAIRLVFNLLHVYTDPQKIATTLEIATGIAGWTIFGVPIVQNFLLISWAALESYVDSEKLMDGESIPLIKTAQSWFLDLNRLKDYLINGVLSQLKTFAVEKVNTAVDDASAYLKETVSSFVSGKVDELFVTIELGYDQAIDYTKGQLDAALFKESDTFVTKEEIKSVDDFLAYLSNALQSKFDAIIKVLHDKGIQRLDEYKQSIKDYLCNLVFESPIYINLQAEIKKLAAEIIDKGINAVSNKLNDVLGAKSGLKSGGNNVLGRLIMMDYTDYLRLMLLAVPAEQKALRTADLMQLNMYAVNSENSHYMSEYQTGLYVKAYIDIHFWFLPEKLFKEGKESMIVVEWSQGY